jgi:hypothetical protein
MEDLGVWVKFYAFFFWYYLHIDGLRDALATLT